VPRRGHRRGRRGAARTAAGIDFAAAPDGDDGPFLPDAEPTDPRDLTAALVVGLPSDETRRALAVLGALKGSAGRLLAVRPRDDDCHDDPEFLIRCAVDAGMLICPARVACAAIGEADPAAAAAALRARGARIVCLTAGPFGGLLRYKDKVCTWPALPTVERHRDRPAIFAGAVAGFCAEAGKADLRTCKRALATASAIAGEAAAEAVRLDRDDCQRTFLKLRRNHKY